MNKIEFLDIDLLEAEYRKFLKDNGKNDAVHLLQGLLIGKVISKTNEIINKLRELEDE